VNLREPALFCVAIPGSGKTHTLTHAIVQRIQSGELHPKQILAVTFTRLAAHEMRRRLGEMLPPHRLRGLTIGTFHSVCYEFIRRNSYLLGYASDQIMVYDREEQRRLLKETIKSSRYNPTQASVLGALDRMAQTGEMPFEMELHRDVHRVVDLYLRALKEHNAVDYAVVPMLALRLIEMDARTPWTDIFADEAQDLDSLQYRLFRLLQPERIFFVGDPDQLIYGWRGADVDLMRNQAREMKAEIKVLDVNYRSDNAILEAANRLIAHNEHRIPKEMKPASEEQGQGVVTLIDEAQQLDYIRGAAVAEGTIAVLGRTNDIITQVSNDLHQLGVEHELIGRRQKVLERPDVKTILSYLCFADYPLSPTVLTRAHAKTKGQTFYRTVLDLYGPLQDFFLTMDEETSLLQKLSFAIAHYRNLKGSMSDLDEADLIRLASDFVRLERWTNRTPGNFVAWLSLRDGQDEVKSDAHLQLMTIHAAKGLEFDTVFITGLHDRLLPHKRNQEGDGLEEERRLMFVAMTRARHSLVLVKSTEWPSRFIAEAMGDT
jgi:DNA helicase-2/ATP-dependent DNA helicase PcrA